MSYTYGWNFPGCLPEMDPVNVDTFDEAKQAIIGELLIRADGWAGSNALLACTQDDADPDESAEFSNTAEDVNLESRPFTTNEMPDGYVYWVQEVEDPKLDEGPRWYGD